MRGVPKPSRLSRARNPPRGLPPIVSPKRPITPENTNGQPAPSPTTEPVRIATLRRLVRRLRRPGPTRSGRLLLRRPGPVGRPNEPRRPRPPEFQGHPRGHAPVGTGDERHCQRRRTRFFSSATPLLPRLRPCPLASRPAGTARLQAATILRTARRAASKLPRNPSPKQIHSLHARRRIKPNQKPFFRQDKMACEIYLSRPILVPFVSVSDFELGCRQITPFKFPICKRY